MDVALAVLAGVLLGALSGGASGFVWGVLGLMGLRAANRARIERGEIPTKNEMRPRMELPGALVGALAGGAYVVVRGLRVTRVLGAAALACLAALVAVYAAALVLLVVEEFRAKRQRKD